MLIYYLEPAIFTSHVINKILGSWAILVLVSAWKKRDESSDFFSSRSVFNINYLQYNARGNSFLLKITRSKVILAPLIKHNINYSTVCILECKIMHANTISVRLKYVFRPCKYRSFEFSSLKLLILPFCHCKY